MFLLDLAGCGLVYPPTDNLLDSLALLHCTRLQLNLVLVAPKGTPRSTDWNSSKDLVIGSRCANQSRNPSEICCLCCCSLFIVIVRPSFRKDSLAFALGFGGALVL